MEGETSFPYFLVSRSEGREGGMEGETSLHITALKLAVRIVPVVLQLPSLLLWLGGRLGRAGRGVGPVGATMSMPAIRNGRLARGKEPLALRQAALQTSKKARVSPARANPARAVEYSTAPLPQARATRASPARASLARASPARGQSEAKQKNQKRSPAQRTKQKGGDVRI